MNLSRFSEINYRICNNDIIIDEIDHDSLSTIISLTGDVNDGYFNKFLKKYGDLMPNLTTIRGSYFDYTLKYIPKTVKHVCAQCIDPQDLWELTRLDIYGKKEFEIRNIDFTMITIITITKFVKIDLSKLINLEEFHVNYGYENMIRGFDDYLLDYNINSEKLLYHNFYLGLSYELPTTIHTLCYHVKQISDISHVKLNVLYLIFNSDIPIKLSNHYVKELTIYRIDQLSTCDIELDFPNVKKLRLDCDYTNEEKTYANSKYESIISKFDCLEGETNCRVEDWSLRHPETHCRVEDWSLRHPETHCDEIELHGLNVDLNLRFDHAKTLTIYLSKNCPNINNTIISSSINKLMIQNCNLKYNIPNLDNLIMTVDKNMEIENMGEEHMINTATMYISNNSIIN